MMKNFSVHLDDVFQAIWCVMVKMIVVDGKMK